MKKTVLFSLLFSSLFFLNVFSQSNLRLFHYTRSISANVNRLESLDSDGNNPQLHFSNYNWGKTPSNEVLLDSNFIYGATKEGGANNCGTVYKVRVADRLYQKLFDLDTLFGYNCLDNPFVKVGNKLFGICENGGLYNKGSMFMYDLSLDTCIKIHDFNISTCYWPSNSLIVNSGKVYGVAVGGGLYGKGAIFRYDISTQTLSFIKDTPFTCWDLVNTTSNKFYVRAYNYSTDSSKICEYDIVSNTLTSKYSQKKKIGPFEYFNNKLYGIGFYPSSSTVQGLFSYDIVSSSFSFLYYFNSAPITIRPRLNNSNKLVYMEGQGFMQFDLLTNNGTYTSIYNSTNMGFSSDFYNYGICVGLNDKYYLMTRGSLGSSSKGFIIEYDHANLTTPNFVNFNNNPEGQYLFGKLFRINGKIYSSFPGGNTINASSIIFEYDPVTNKRKSKIDFSQFTNATGGYMLHAVGTNSKLYGFGNHSVNSVVFEYDPVTDSIRTTPLPSNINSSTLSPPNLIETSPNTLMFVSHMSGIYEYNHQTSSVNLKLNFQNFTYGGSFYQLGYFINDKAINGKLYGTCTTGQADSLYIYEYDITSNSISNIKSIGYLFPAFSGQISPLSSVYANNNCLYVICPEGNFSTSTFGFIIEYNLFNHQVTLKHTLTSSNLNENASCMSFCLSTNGKIYTKTRESLYEYDIQNDLLVTKYLNSGNFAVANTYFSSNSMYPICDHGFIITSQPTSYYSCNSTGTFSLGVSVSHPNDVAYQWFLNNQAIPGATLSVYSNTLAGTADNGNYYCSIFNGCDFKKTDTVFVNFGLPVLSISYTPSVCIGTSANLTVSGATTYTWNTGATTSSITVTPTTTTIYTVTGANSSNCSNTQTVSVVVDNTCQDVWPGDANSDGTADNLDVLELGLHYTQTGAPRASTSNTWQSYFATNWVGTITNGKNLNHSDCNGDGTIDNNDTLAIFNNYGLTHAFKPEQAAVINPQLSIVPDQAYVTKGNWGTASIYAGDATNPITNINGLAFTLDFNSVSIEVDSIYLEYSNSFLDAGQNLHFRKLDFANGKIFTATTHTLSNNVSGNGLIGKLHYQIKSSLTTDEVLNIGLSQANQSNASGTIVPLTSGTATLMAIGASVGLQELNGNVISVSPNPTNGLLTINSKTELQKIEVVAITGQVLLSETPTNVSYTMNLDNFANGIYFVNLYQNNRIVKREKVVLNK